MKLIKTAGIFILSVIFLSMTVAAADIFSVRTALNIDTPQKSCGISAPAGAELEFSAEDLEIRLELEPNSLQGVTFTSLPQVWQGTIELDGNQVSAFEYVDRAGLDRLRFIPKYETVTSSVTFIPRAEDSAPTELTINVTDEWAAPPELRDFSFETIRDIAVSGYVQVSGAYLADSNIRTVKPPKKGVVRFNGLKFTYTPYPGASGRDSFTIRAADPADNYSNEATVSVRIEKLKNPVYYADMVNHPSAYAAMKLQEKGVMTGEQVGDKAFFSPGRATTRGELIVLLLAAAGLEDSIRPAVNTGLENDLTIPLYLKPYVKRAVEAGILPPEQPFAHNEVPTRAEAVILVARAAKLESGLDALSHISDVSDIPAWATPSYKSLAERGMLVLHDNAAHPLDGLTNGYSADLAWQLWRYCHQ